MILLVDTIPKDARNQGSVNLGFEIVKEKLSADTCFWWEQVDITKYDRIAFNVFYPMHILNIVPFLTRNNIEVLKQKRNQTPYLIVGGQGIGKNHILKDIVDEEYYGELDAEDNIKEITSKAVIKNNKAVIELTRGCKYRCVFCEYGHVYGGKYREKNIDFVKKQILDIKEKNVKNVNFISSNFAGYSNIDELIQFCIDNKIRILNSDSCLNDVDKILPHTKHLSRTIKLGVESFDEKSRFLVKKKITDEKLLELVKTLTDKFSYLHFYLIFGIPDDNYDNWIKWLKILSDLRKNYDKPVRYEFNITNLEPCTGTPFSEYDVVDFKKKEEFLKIWTKALIEYGFHKGTEITYYNCGGRLGRKENSYNMLMELKTKSDITDKLIYPLKRGVSRSVSDKEALKFLNYGENIKHDEFWNE